jgi:hypothetical protein
LINLENLTSLKLFDDNGTLNQIDLFMSLKGGCASREDTPGRRVVASRFAILSGMFIFPIESISIVLHLYNMAH